MFVTILTSSELATFWRFLNCLGLATGLPLVIQPFISPFAPSVVPSRMHCGDSQQGITVPFVCFKVLNWRNLSTWKIWETIGEYIVTNLGIPTNFGNPTNIIPKQWDGQWLWNFLPISKNLTFLEYVVFKDFINNHIVMSVHEKNLIKF